VEEAEASSFSFFHVIMMMGSCYLAMLLTNWTIVGSDSMATIDPNSDNAPMWAKLTSMFVCILLYVWTLVAPMIFRDRDFGRWMVARHPAHRPTSLRACKASQEAVIFRCTTQYTKPDPSPVPRSAPTSSAAGGRGKVGVSPETWASWSSHTSRGHHSLRHGIQT